MENGKVLQIGAGNIGRALIGEVMHEAGMHVTFADVNERVVNELNKQKGYAVDVVSLEGGTQKYIDNVDAVVMGDEDTVIDHIVEADMITTAVGVNILPKIAPLLARGLMQRLALRPNNDVHVAVVACENVEKNTETLRDYIVAELPSEEWRQRILGKVSFPNCAVDRIVPNAKATNDNPLGVTTEDYYQLAIDKTSLKAELPHIPGIELVDDLQAVLAQKLFTLNGAHAAVAYWGHLKGYESIADAMQDRYIASLAQGLMEEVSAVITSRYPSVTVEQQAGFAQKTLRRFMNPHLHDEPKRVGREPKRKLGRGDRLLQPALLSLEHGQNPANITMAMVGGLLFESPGDIQAVELHQDIKELGVEGALVGVTGLAKAHPLVRQTAAGYKLARIAA